MRPMTLDTPQTPWLRRVGGTMGLIVVGLAIVLASQIRNPYLSFFRPAGLWLAIGVGLALTALGFTGWLRWRSLWGVLFAIGGLALVAVPTQRETAFRAHRSTVLTRPSDRVELFSRHVILGYRDVERLAELLERVELAGIFVTRRNVAGRGVGEVRAEIERLQQIQRGRGRPPLLVAANQEGGIIARLSPPLDPVPSLAVVADTVNWRAAVTDYAQQKARNLRALGITLNFAPVVDLKDESVTVTIDLHSLISKRAIAAAPERVAEVADLYVESLARHGVLATAKHFPGIGRVSADTHHFVGHLDRPRAALIANEWLPFKQLRQRQVAVMVSHVIVDQIDPVNPASSSRAMVHDVLRGALGHTGLVITDDLCMSPVVYAEGGVAGVAARSLRAGTDLLLIAWDPELVYPMLAGLLERESDAGSAGHLKASNRRIARTRELLRVIPEDR